MASANSVGNKGRVEVHVFAESFTADSSGTVEVVLDRQEGESLRDELTEFFGPGEDYIAKSEVEP